jgi:hypothetical protein
LDTSDGKYVLIDQEAGSAKQVPFAGIVDISNETKPSLITIFPPFKVPYGAPFKNYIDKGGPIGVHNWHQAQNHPDLEDRPDRLYCTGFNAGVRVYDFSDPYLPKEIACFIPPDPKKNLWPIPDMMTNGVICANCQDILVDKRGYIYVTDSNGGLYILRCLV